MENVKQDKERELERLEKIMQETTAENRQLRTAVTGKEEVTTYYLNFPLLITIVCLFSYVCRPILFHFCVKYDFRK